MDIDMWVRIYYEHRGAHERVVTWKKDLADCKRFIEQKGGVFIKVVAYHG